jgi:hypothetical protein
MKSALRRRRRDAAAFGETAQLRSAAQCHIAWRTENRTQPAALMTCVRLRRV